MKFSTPSLLLATIVASSLPTLVNAAAADVESLSAQINALQMQVNALKAQLPANRSQHVQKNVRNARAYARTKQTPITRQAAPQTKLKPATEPTQTHRPQSIQDAFRLSREQRTYLPFDLDVPGQAFVSTGPYIGVPIQYSGSNLIINSPSVNTDLQLLALRKSILQQENLLGVVDHKNPHHSHLLFSGIIEGQANYMNIGGQPSTTNIDVTNVTLDTFVLGPSEWLLGFLELTYDNSALSPSNYTVANSRVLVNKAFVTVGNLIESPYYASFGQYYVPFGTYSSVMLSDPLTKLVARTKARAITVGFQQQTPNAFYGAAYIFRGDAHAASVSKINNGGLNVGYKFSSGQFSANVGAGLIANLADSGGMQAGTGFQSQEQIAHRVPAVDLHALVSIGEHVNLIGEYVGATTAFNTNDMMYQGHGAKPWAIDTEAAYSFMILGDKPSSIGVGYGHSAQALALGIPQNRYSLVFNTSLRRNTLQSLEFRHDTSYAASNTANGPGGTTSSCTSASCTSTGKSTNVITASFDYYF